MGAYMGTGIDTSEYRSPQCVQVDPVRVRDVVLRARDFVAAGWTQYRCLDNDGNVCAEGALALACGASKDELKNNSVLLDESADMWVYQAARGHVARVIGQQLHAWNDALEREQADVLKAFDAVIERIDRQIASGVAASPSLTYTRFHGAFPDAEDAKEQWSKFAKAFALPTLTDVDIHQLLGSGVTVVETPGSGVTVVETPEVKELVPA